MSKGGRSCRYAGDLEPADRGDTADNLVPVNMGGNSNGREYRKRRSL